jgi:hypothetical protein
MSLVASYVKANDGLYYEGPWRAEDQSWFICLDDDDPPELVVFLKDYPELRGIKKDMKSLRAWIKEHIPLPFYVTSYRGISERVKTKNFIFKEAISMFGFFEGYPPPPKGEKGTHEWRGSLSLNLCPNHGSFDNNSPRCLCGNCSNGWLDIQSGFQGRRYLFL